MKAVCETVLTSLIMVVKISDIRDQFMDNYLMRMNDFFQSLLLFNKVFLAHIPVTFFNHSVLMKNKKTENVLNDF